MTKPLFSILIANYNNGRFFKDCYESIIKQTYKNWEVIIVDDGSTDDSVAIIKEIISSDSRFRFFENEKNYGCGYTKKRCINIASGEICGFLDPDDALLPSAIQHMVKIHSTNKNISLVFSRFYVCDERLEVKKESRRLSLNKNQNYLEARQYAPEAFSSFTKEAYNKTTGLNPANKRGVDQDLFFKLEEVGDLYISDTLTYKYRQHSGGISAGNRNKSFYWNMMIRHEACIRRGINPEELTFYDFDEHNKNIMFEMEYKITNSKTYKLGKYLTSWLKK